MGGVQYQTRSQDGNLHANTDWKKGERLETIGQFNVVSKFFQQARLLSC